MVSAQRKRRLAFYLRELPGVSLSIRDDGTWQATTFFPEDTTRTRWKPRAWSLGKADDGGPSLALVDELAATLCAAGPAGPPSPAPSAPCAVCPAPSAPAPTTTPDVKPWIWPFRDGGKAPTLTLPKGFAWRYDAEHLGTWAATMTTTGKPPFALVVYPDEKASGPAWVGLACVVGRGTKADECEWQTKALPSVEEAGGAILRYVKWMESRDELPDVKGWAKLKKAPGWEQALTLRRHTARVFVTKGMVAPGWVVSVEGSGIPYTSDVVTGSASVARAKGLQAGTKALEALAFPPAVPTTTPQRHEEARKAPAPSVAPSTGWKPPKGYSGATDHQAARIVGPFRLLLYYQASLAAWAGDVWRGEDKVQTFYGETPDAVAKQLDGWAKNAAKAAERAAKPQPIPKPTTPEGWKRRKAWHYSRTRWPWSADVKVSKWEGKGKAKRAASWWVKVDDLRHAGAVLWEGEATTLDDATRQAVEHMDLEDAKPKAEQAPSLLAAAPPPEPERPPCPESEPACRLGVVGGTCALPAALFVLASGERPERQTARFCVVDVAQLQASHLPASGFIPNPAYPPDTQTRDYFSSKELQNGVLEHAATFEPLIAFGASPDAMHGPPVVTPGGVVLGGNSRTMSLALYYRDHDDGGEVKAWLVQHAKDYGLLPRDVSAVAHPVVVRVVSLPDESPATLRSLVQRYNESMAHDLDATEAAVAMARLLDKPAMDALSEGMLPEQTLTQFLTSKASEPFIAHLRRVKVLTATTVPRLLTKDGLLSDEGRSMVARMLVGTLFDNSALLEAIGPELRNTLGRCVPAIVRASGAREDWNPRPGIQAACRDVVRVRRLKEKGEVKGPADYLAHMDLLTSKAHEVDGVNLGPEFLHILWTLGGSPVKLNGLMEGYADAASRRPRGQQGLAFDVAPEETPSDALRRLATVEGVSFE